MRLIAHKKLSIILKWPLLFLRLRNNIHLEGGENDEMDSPLGAIKPIKLKIYCPSIDLFPEKDFEASGVVPRQFEFKCSLGENIELY